MRVLGPANHIVILWKLTLEVIVLLSRSYEQLVDEDNMDAKMSSFGKDLEHMMLCVTLRTDCCIGNELRVTHMTPLSPRIATS